MNSQSTHDESSSPKGVMTEDYARDRTRKPSLSFRFKARALESIRAYEQHASNTSPPKLHLDFGAADGLCSKILHQGLRAEKTIGIEYSPEIAAFSKQAGLPPSCEIRVGDVFEEIAPLSPSSVDVITALAFLEHVADPVNLFRRSLEILRPGGLFIATCPEPLWDNISGSLGLHKDEHHEQEFTKRLFHTVADQGGLSPVLYKRFMNVFTGFLPYLRIPVTPRVSAALDSVLRLIPGSRLFFVNQLFVARKP